MEVNGRDGEKVVTSHERERERVVTVWELDILSYLFQFLLSFRDGVW